MDRKSVVEQLQKLADLLREEAAKLSQEATRDRFTEVMLSQMIDNNEGLAVLLRESARVIADSDREIASLQNTFAFALENIEGALKVVNSAVQAIGVNVDMLRIREADATFDLKGALTAIRSADIMMDGVIETEGLFTVNAAIICWRQQYADVLKMAEVAVNGGSHG